MVTLAFPYRHDNVLTDPHPCSDTNHLILASWEGSDKYEALNERIKDIYATLIELDIPILLGGDLAFLCTNFGLHSSMNRPCPWCSHTFDKSASGDKKSIPFEPVILERKKLALRREPIWPIDLKNVYFKL